MAKYWFFMGKAKWAKLDKPDEKYGFYSINFYPDDIPEFKKTGLGLKFHDDADGTFVRLRRDPDKLLEGMAEKPIKLIYNPDTKSYDPFDRLIGNGSLVEVKIQVYDSQKGKGHRLEAVAVHKLVPYGDEEQGELPF